MTENNSQLSFREWPRMTQTVDEAAAGLHPRYGKEGIASDVLKREIERIGG